MRRSRKPRPKRGLTMEDIARIYGLPLMPKIEPISGLSVIGPRSPQADQALYGFSAVEVNWEPGVWGAWFTGTMGGVRAGYDDGSVVAYTPEWEAAWADLGAPVPPEATPVGLPDQSIDPAAWDRDNRVGACLVPPLDPGAEGVRLDIQEALETAASLFEADDLTTHADRLFGSAKPGSGQLFWKRAMAEIHAQYEFRTLEDALRPQTEWSNSSRVEILPGAYPHQPGPHPTSFHYDEIELMDVEPAPMPERDSNGPKVEGMRLWRTGADVLHLAMDEAERAMLANIAHFYLRNAPCGPLPDQRRFAESLTKDRS